MQIQQYLQCTKEHITQERLFSKITCSPEIAAKILGCSLKIVDRNLSSFELHFVNGATTDSLQLLSPIFALWRQSGKTAENASQKAQDIDLFQHILVPFLDLLQKCRLQANCFHLLLYDELKSSVKQCLIEPLLRAFKVQTSSSSTEKVDFELQSAELLAPLNEYITSSILISEEKSCSNLALVSLFLDTVLESLELKSPQDGLNEGPWLRLLSAQILRYLHQATPSDAAPLADVAQVVKSMMRSFGSYNLSFDAPSLKHVFTHYFRPDLAADYSPDWEVMSMCLEIEPKLLYSTRMMHHVNTESAGASSNTILGAICAVLRALNPSAHRQGTYSEYTNSLLANFKMFTHSAVLPVLETFTKSRKLDEFLDLWEEQLRLTKDISPLTRDAQYRTIWENEDIKTRVSSILSTQLSVDQTTRRVMILLEDIQNTLSAGRTVSCDRSGWRGSLLLLECLLSGLRYSDKSHELFQICFSELSTIAMASPTTPNLPTWRIWSILSLITRHLAKIPGGQDSLVFDMHFKDLCTELATDHDLVYLARNPEDLYCEFYQEQFETFKFLVNWNKPARTSRRIFFNWNDPPPFLKGLSDSLRRSKDRVVELYASYGHPEQQDELVSCRPLTEVYGENLALECAEWLIIDDLEMKYIVSYPFEITN